MFSTIAISPGFKALTIVNVSEPFKSSIKVIGVPTNSPNLLAIGFKDNSGFLSPFGLPKCAKTIIFAFFFLKSLIVVTLAFNRPSSVICITPLASCFIGAFKSARNKTR